MRTMDEQYARNFDATIASPEASPVAPRSGRKFMNFRRYTSVVLSSMVGCALVARAAVAQQTPAADQPKVPVKQLGPVEARSAQSVNAVSMLRALPDGGIFVNDAQRRRLVHFDATLQHQTVIADTAGAPLPYGQRPSGLLPYLGDSTIIVDPSTLSFVVLNPAGKVVKVMAPPRISDINQLANTNLGSNAFDSKGRLIYRSGGGGGGGGAFFGAGGGRGGPPGGGGGGGGAGGQRGGGAGGFGGVGAPGGAPGAQPAGGGPRPFTPQAQPDSVPLIRADFDTRKSDTLAWVKVPKTDVAMQQGSDGGMHMIAKINPLPQGDDWALLSDGTVAVVREIDYHVDFYAADGTKSSSAKLPFDWKRITDDEKQKLVDSLKVLAKDVNDKATAAAALAGGANRGFRMTFEPVAPEKLPDYVPSIRPGTTLADQDGNLWILPATSSLAAQFAQATMGGGRGGFGGGGGFPGGGPPGGGRGGPPGGDASAAAARGAAGGRGAGRDSTPGAARPARDTTAGPPQPTFQYVYDVVNRKGELVHRVQLPQNRTIVGFGPGGVVYLSAREGRNIFIEKARGLSNAR